jgi:hypothetical protein
MYKSNLNFKRLSRPQLGRCEIVFFIKFYQDGDFRIESTEQFRVLYSPNTFNNFKTNSNSARLSLNRNLPSSKGWFGKTKHFAHWPFKVFLGQRQSSKKFI